MFLKHSWHLLKRFRYSIFIFFYSFSISIFSFCTKQKIPFYLRIFFIMMFFVGFCYIAVPTFQCNKRRDEPPNALHYFVALINNSLCCKLIYFPVYGNICQINMFFFLMLFYNCLLQQIKINMFPSLSHESIFFFLLHFGKNSCSFSYFSFFLRQNINQTHNL